VLEPPGGGERLGDRDRVRRPPFADQPRDVVEDRPMRLAVEVRGRDDVADAVGRLVVEQEPAQQAVDLFRSLFSSELLAELREATGGYEVPDDGCASYRALYEGLAELEADTHLHVHKENNVLFPAVIALEHATAAR